VSIANEHYTGRVRSTWCNSPQALTPLTDFARAIPWRFTTPPPCFVPATIRVPGMNPTPAWGDHPDDYSSWLVADTTRAVAPVFAARRPPWSSHPAARLHSPHLLASWAHAPATPVSQPGMSRTKL